MNSIPFELPDVGLQEIRGKLYLDQEFLVFEVQVALIGEFNKEFQTIKIEPGALKEIHLDRGVIKDRLCIRPKKSDLLTAMPGEYHGEICLKLWVKYREQAEQLIEEIRRRSGK